MQTIYIQIQYFSSPDDRFTVSPWAVIAETQNQEFWEISEKVWTSRQERIRTHGNDKTRQLPGPWPAPVYKLSMTSMVWNISFGQPGCLPGRAPSQLRHTCSFAEHGGLKNSPWFLSNNWKRQCHQHSSHTKSKTQQLLGGKLTLPQPKPGHTYML